MAAEGHVRKRGSRWEYTIELGWQPRQRCSACNVKEWGISLRACPSCSGPLTLADERRQRSKGGFTKQKDALRAMREDLGRRDTGHLVDPQKITVAQYLDEWLATVKARSRPSTYDATEQAVRVYLQPRIGTVPLQRLTRTRVKALYAELRTSGRKSNGGALSEKTVYNLHRTLSLALTDAVADGLLSSNVAARLVSRPESPQQDTWAPGQLATFLHHVASHWLFALWRLAASTGMRRGELLGLRWADVDFENSRLAIVQQRARGGGQVNTGPPKTKRSRRPVPLDVATVAALREHRKRQAENRLRWGAGYDDQGWVFCLPNGQAIEPSRITQMFRELCKEAKLPYIKFHGLRHTWATIALQANVHPKVVQERLGHSSIAITLDTYSHAIPAMQEDAAEHVANLFDAAAEEQEERRKRGGDDA